MKIVEDYRGCYPDGVERYWNLQQFSNDNNTVLFHGMGCIEDPRYKQKYENYEKKAFINLEHPCAWQSSKTTRDLSSNIDRYFDKIFTICPYSAEWLNDIQSDDVYIPHYIPFEKQHVVDKKEEKIFDAIYWGGIHSEENFKIVDSIKDFKYNFLSLGPQHWAGHFRNSPAKKMITSYSVPRKVMWSLLRQTKVCPMSNLLFLQEPQIRNIKSMHHWDKCDAFSNLDKFIMPQNKTRMIECAVNRTLILVKRNPWKLDEMWFTPDEDFIYFDDYSELPSIIDHISKNWHNYEQIVENAFAKATTKYTVENFINQITEEIR
tara:strand:- start:1532 stop:2491 length:960 start_codon:yes stop_codon:yes gene_type:complete